MLSWNKVAVIGVGLLGGSIGLALKRKGLAKRVFGFVRREASVRECLEAGAVDEAGLDLGEAVRGAELIVLCTPIGRMIELSGSMAPGLMKGALVTDVGSVKAPIAAALTRQFAQARCHYVGSHPMAGKESTGVCEASEKLFEGSVAVVAPIEETNQDALKTILELWRSLGCRTLQMPPEEHDRLAAKGSHLPHLLAAELARFVLGDSRPAGQWELCATGFQDATRIASGAPGMWRDILMSNRENVLDALGAWILQLEELKRALESGAADGLEERLRSAKDLRDQWVENRNGRPS